LLDERQQMSVGSEMFLFMASRAQLVDEVIRPALAAGQVVVSDRFLLANVVYQGHAGGLDPQRIWDIGQTATGGLLPDLTLVLDLPVEISLQRRKTTADRLESRDLDFHRRVRDGFLTEARLRPDRIRVIDARPDIETVHQAICQAVQGLHQSVSLNS
jgi:dTMP kinase